MFYVWCVLKTSETNVHVPHLILVCYLLFMPFKFHFFCFEFTIQGVWSHFFWFLWIYQIKLSTTIKMVRHWQNHNHGFITVTCITLFATCAVYSLSYFTRRGEGEEVDRTNTMYIHMKENTSVSDKNEKITNKTSLDIA